MTDELDIPYDLGISSVFSRDYAPLSTIFVLIELLSFTADLSRRPISPPPPWFRRDVPVLLLQLPPWPN